MVRERPAKHARDSGTGQELPIRAAAQNPRDILDANRRARHEADAWPCGRPGHGSRAICRRGAVLRRGFTLTLPAPLAEKAPNEMRKQKYDASEGDMREGLAKAAQLAGLTAPLAFTALGADLFLVVRA